MPFTIKEKKPLNSISWDRRVCCEISRRAGVSMSTQIQQWTSTADVVPEVLIAGSHCETIDFIQESVTKLIFAVAFNGRFNGLHKVRVIVTSHKFLGFQKGSVLVRIQV